MPIIFDHELNLLNSNGNFEIVTNCTYNGEETNNVEQKSTVIDFVKFDETNYVKVISIQAHFMQNLGSRAFKGNENLSQNL